eukprot:CAMPEP_0183559816 /NCGR_PEP_ID=MMETSP0371-20130417/92940_1 /TAXON_ID=268820 /ORGANISM="Peridinium aciculiferum, Strain PAER-2" /LENGTH=386 /DNA_ID=CAMNT_0025767799 /DNA_START=36 /DNA_END=1196 /DNA_ORIENTATION=-
MTLRSRAGTLAIAGGAFYVCAAPCVLAWDKDGHEAIGMTAMSALELNATAEVKHLMGGRDAVDIAAWAHKVNKKHPWTIGLHFQAQSGLKCKGGAELSCPDNKCLVKALKYFYGRLIHKDLVSISWPEGMKLTDADCVKYLINLIGDLHQPMHLGLAADDMGRNLTVMFRGKKSSLYEFWNRELTQLTIQGSPGFWWGGWTHVKRSHVEYHRDGENWKRDGVVSFDKWAEESAKYLCDNVYTNPISGRKLEEGLVNGVFRIDENLYELWQREMLSKMLVAGARVAIVLNAVLHNRDAGQALHSGSAIQDLEDEPDSMTPQVAHLGRQGDSAHAVHSGQVGPVAAAMNFGIFMTVGLIFLQVMRMWQGRDAVTKANRAKHQDGGKGT